MLYYIQCILFPYIYYFHLLDARKRSYAVTEFNDISLFVSNWERRIFSFFREMKIYNEKYKNNVENAKYKL